MLRPPGYPSPSPLSPRSFGINKIRRAGRKIFESKGLTGKIRKTKKIALEDRSPTGTFPLNYGAVIGVLSQEQILEFWVGSIVGRAMAKPEAALMPSFRQQA